MLLLQPAFVHVRSSLCFATVVAGLTVRTDLHGVTSIVRALKLFPRCYDTLLKHFHGNAVRLDALAALWARTLPRLFPQPLRVNGRLVLIGDGIKVTKYGKKMPGVKLLHQQAEHKVEWIMGHSLQAVSLLVHAADAFVAVPLAGMMIAGLREQGHHLLTRLKANAVAYLPYEHQGPRKRGRPRRYGEKIALTALFDHASHIAEVASPVVWGEGYYAALCHTRSALEACWDVGPPGGRRAPATWQVRAAMHGYHAGPRGDHPALRATFQNRARLQAGASRDRGVRLPFLDESDDAVATRRRQSVSPSQNPGVPGRRAAQATLPCISASWRHRARVGVVSLGDSSQPSMGFLWVVVADDTAGHHSLGVRGRRGATPYPPAISPRIGRSSHFREIHHATPRSPIRRDVEHRRVIQKFLLSSRLQKYDYSIHCG